MKFNKFAYLYLKPLGNHTLKIMEKIPGNLLKNLEKSWKYHGILSVRKSGNPELLSCKLVKNSLFPPDKFAASNVSPRSFGSRIIR